MLWVIAGWLAGRRLVAQSTIADLRLVALLRESAGDPAKAEVRISHRLSAAVATGLRHPVILLPEKLAAEAKDRDLRAVLAHEIAHIERGDLWLLAALRSLSVILWLNPLFWVLQRRVRLDQEILADAAAADRSDRITYAFQLVHWAREINGQVARRPTAVAAGIWESDSQIRTRVALLLDPQFSAIRRTSLRWRTALGAACGGLAIAASSVSVGPAADPSEPAELATQKGSSVSQRMIDLPVKVVDRSTGRPVVGAKLFPWALRSSQGHGLWLEEDQWAETNPQEVITDNSGVAVLQYPLWRDVQEQTRTTSVTIRVNHPDFAFVDSLDIDVPLERTPPFVVELDRGVPLEVRPRIEGGDASLQDLYALWSDGRSYRPGEGPVRSADGVLRFPAMRPGKNSLLLVKLQDETPTHFSEIIDFVLTPGRREKALEIPLQPAVKIEGVLSENVPRPVRNGRIKLWTLPPPDADPDRAGWFTWIPIQADGSFTIDAWPASEPIQLIALCDGYIASSGEPPDAVTNPPAADRDPFHRPQIFQPDAGQIVVAMSPLVKCIATTVDEDGEPVAGIRVGSWPNVGWWNGGSQIYGHPLVRGERLLRDRDYQSSIDEAYPQPFVGVTDGNGQATLELPEGEETIDIESDVYELPIALGSRSVKVHLEPGETSEVTLRLQPRGTDRLGEWDKLAGVVFGCSTREGRRICALPGVQEKVEEIRQKYREAQDPRDPKLLSETYALVAEAFAGVGDQEESARWLAKSVEQASRIQRPEPRSP